jgi:hypothetical protein
MVGLGEPHSAQKSCCSFSHDGQEDLPGQEDGINQVLRLNPKTSVVTKESAAGDPEFWISKPPEAAKKK